ncbi:hypothetical protein TNIN_487581 [Trichonephila inaurata madagascariensis]|uniref:Uncharacterized protein n=1 Tax=Trichonephila inaurata madagascariensis TaxID=2747483 RepID=A0A8X6J6H6_9ARAC|nr:hypothetical protein TNIN_487581 [Trichonephila inaurata madagascariensis]
MTILKNLRGTDIKSGLSGAETTFWPIPQGAKYCQVVTRTAPGLSQTGGKAPLTGPTNRALPPDFRGVLRRRVWFGFIFSPSVLLDDLSAADQCLIFSNPQKSWTYFSPCVFGNSNRDTGFRNEPAWDFVDSILFVVRGVGCACLLRSIYLSGKIIRG